MTKFDIFVVNLRRSVDRREAMREKIKQIRGFEKIYIDDEMVCGKNSSLGASCGDFENFGRFTDAQVQSHAPNFQKTTQSPPQILEFVDSNQGDSNESTPFCHTERSEVSKSNESNQMQNAMTQKRINESHRFAQNQRIVGDSQVAKMDSSRCRAQNDDNFILRHSEGAKQPKNPRINSESFLDSLQCYTKNDKISMDSQNITLHFHFFDATDAKDYNFANLPPQYSSKLTRFVKGKDLSFGEMACFSSHYRLWQKCVALDSPIIVLEDDIDFMQDFCQIVDIFKSPFEYVRLYYLFDRKITHLRDNFYISFGKIAGTQGYYLTPQAAKRFIKNAKFWLFCVDDYMDMFFIHSVKNIIFKPFIISEDLDSVSTISGREKPQMRFYQKLTRELSRIYFFVIRKYLYFALHFVEIRAFFRAHKVAH